MLAEDPKHEVRRIYDNIYEVIKGTYSPREYITSYYEGNLLAGKRYIHNVTSWYNAASTDSKSTYLTDGILPSGLNSSGYMGVLNQKSVSVEFNFSNDPLTFKELHIDLMHNPSYAIYLPHTVGIYIKPEMGSGWVNVFYGDYTNAASNFAFDKKTTVYGLKIEFSNCSQHTFIREIMAFLESTNSKVHGTLSLPAITGDVNGDKLVDNSDYELLKDYFAGYDVKIIKNAADINGNNIIERRDLLRLAKIITNS